MCGIFGLVSWDGAVDPAALDAGTDLVAHRGPDGRGTWIGGAVGLGHRRLAILDTSDAGLQPMRHAEVPVTLVYNGEVYNYLELRDELQALGHRFRTGTDTEVILAAYLAWGTDCVQRFNGMWALVLFDERDGRLFASRDRFGVKPLFWLETPQRLAFGSEMRQLLPLLPRRIGRLAAVRDFLASGLSDHDEAGWVAGVQSLPPGCSLVCEVATRRVRIERHYVPRPAAELPRSAAEVAERVAALLQDAVRLRLRSDVRVGTCLSGGLDSSAIATLASTLQPEGAERFRAITAISETPENSEEGYARQVVERASLAWIPVRPDAERFIASLDEIVRTQEVPFGGPSVAMQHFVMQAARDEGVKVLLDGQGADECWFGYQRHIAVGLREAARAGIGPFGRALRDARAQQGDLSAARLAGIAVGAWAPSLAARAMPARYPGLRGRLGLPAAWQRYLRDVPDAAAIETSDLLVTSLPMLLRHADRSSMWHGVEARLPFLDWRLVELSLATPARWKLHDGWSKWPLRRALAGRLPDEIAWRRRKLGFEAPDRVWLRRAWPEMRSRVAASGLLGELFHRSTLQQAFDGLPRTQAWRLYSLAAWERHQGIEGLA